MNGLNYGGININFWIPDGIIKAKIFKKQIHEQTHPSNAFFKQTPKKLDFTVWPES